MYDLKKRAIALLCVLTMGLSLLPSGSAKAAEAETTIGEFSAEESSGDSLTPNEGAETSSPQETTSEEESDLTGTEDSSVGTENTSEGTELSAETTAEESTAAAETEEVPQNSEWPGLSGWDPGNSSENLLNGGYIVMDGEDIYYVNREDGCIYREYDDSFVTEGSAKNLNASAGTLFFTVSQGTESSICRVSTDGSGRETLYTHGETIRQMYVINGERAYFLTDSGIWSYDFRVPGEARQELAQNGLCGFIPTEQGMVYATGELFSYTLYAGGYQIDSGVSSYYTYDSSLIYTKGDDTYQADVDSLFTGVPSYAVEEYQPVTFYGGDDLVELDEVCEETDSPVLYDTEPKVVQSSTLSYPKVGVSKLDSATERQKNIVNRARQQLEITWTPLQDITGWRGLYVFKKGVTYHGIPYGQPVYEAYVPWEDAGTNPRTKVTFATFQDAVKDINSKMYTKTCTYPEAPYYSSDCSSFVSYAWNLKSRHWTSILNSTTFSEKVATQSVYGAQIGDILLKSGSHVVIIRDIGYDSEGNMLYVDIIEQTDPIVQYVRYGKGGAEGSTLERLNSRFFNSGYILYRLKSDWEVPYTHDCAAPLTGETCDKCGGAGENNGGTGDNGNTGNTGNNGNTGNTTPPTSPVTPGNARILYSTHMQTYGWSAWAQDGETSGNPGGGKRMEAFNAKLKDAEYTGSVEYRAYVQGTGWTSWKSGGNEAGTIGKALRAEAVEVRLTGEMANHYDVYYRTYLQGTGWLSWAKNGQTSGSAGAGMRLEAIQMKLVVKNGTAPGDTNEPSAPTIAPVTVKYQAHVQTYGWQDVVTGDKVAGTTGLAKRLEALKIWVDSEADVDVEYLAHCQTYGWLNWQKNGTVSGTTGLAKRMEAIRIKLTGADADKYDIYYRVHCQTFGWLDWAKNGAPAGSAGYAKRMEAIQVVVVPKGSAAPGSTLRAYYEQ